MAVYGAEIKPNLGRQQLRTDQARDYLLELAQLDVSAARANA